MNEQLCSICHEYENKYACVMCDFCKDGIICCNCDMDYEDYYNGFYLQCPCCQLLLINHSKRNIIINALIYKIGITKSNNLIQRWLNNYYESDFYIKLGK
jgi:hypothetical protein